MTDNESAATSEPTAVDDVRRVRETIAGEHAGDLRKHVEESSRIGLALRAQLGVRTAPAAAPRVPREVG